MTEPTVGFAIPSIPPRTTLLLRAIASITAQTYPISQISVAIDRDSVGAGPTRNRAMRAITTEFTCLMDDDDVLYPFHVEALIEHQRETGADLVFPWFDVIGGGTDPFPQHEGLPWDSEHPRIFPITVLVRTSLLQQAEFPAPNPDSSDWHGDDYPVWLKLEALGGTISHLNRRTWQWDHSSNNTSGLPWKRNRKAPW